MIDTIRERLQERIAASENPCVMWSGGADSTLVLALAREAKPDIDVCQFRIDMSPYQKRFVDTVIADHGFSVFTWSPAHRFFTPYKDTLALADIYAWGASHIPVVRKLIRTSDRCAFDLSPARTPEMDERFDVFLMGILGTDEEYGEKIATSGFVGNTAFYSPLWDVTKDDVLAMLAELGLPVDERVRSGDERADTGMIECCFDCLKIESGTTYCPKAGKEIDAVKWDRNENRELLMKFMGM